MIKNILPELRLAFIEVAQRAAAPPPPPPGEGS